jgi:hypothetical protein
LIGNVEATRVIGMFFRDFFLSWLSPVVPQIVLLNATSPLDADQFTIYTIQEGDVLFRFAIVNASDLSIKYQLFFIR